MEVTRVMKIAAMSDIGRLRTTNEDCLLVDAPLGLLIVADGMGGHAGGEVASALAVEAIATYVRRHLVEFPLANQTAALLQAAICTADQVIWAKARAHRALHGMGTTAVVTLCHADEAYIAHVGDSRAYHLHQGELRQVTEDHSVVARMIKAGQLTPRQARLHSLRHQITRYLGRGDAVAELSCITWQRGDYLLLCSDGLTTMVKDQHLKDLILQAGADIQAACEALVARANLHGGEDNISVILAYHDYAGTRGPG
jgi:protein phosphatase